MRDKQKAVLLELESALKSGYKRIFFEAPTGFGKTPVAITLAQYLGSSHICTATKDLQSQYRRDFPFILDVKGRGNFSCIVKDDMGLEESCDYGPCVRDDGYNCAYKTRLADYRVEAAGTKGELVTIDRLAQRKYVEDFKSHTKLVSLEWRPCHYYDQKWRGVMASHTVYNYRYFLSDIFYAGSSQKRNLLVLDEAHQLESEIGDFRSFSVSKNSLRLLKMQMPERGVEDIDTWLEFCDEMRERLGEFSQKAEGILERSGQKVNMEPYTEKNLIDALERLESIEKLVEDIKSSKENWIVAGMQRDPVTSELIKATLTPLDVSSYFNTVLEKCSVGLFMSATILSQDYLCKTTGLNPADVKFIRILDSDFPPANRPIFFDGVAWLNAKNMAENMPAITRKIDEIMNRHRHEKGIIHTTSYYQLESIKNGISPQNAKRLIQTSSSIDRNKILQKHIESREPTVLISPSLHQGVDLKDELSRFQIIVKIPYPDLTDRKIAAMKARDPNWYVWTTVLRLVQSYGRSVRSKEDHASTYVLDKNFSYLLKNAGKMVPSWFTEAIIGSLA